MVIISTTPSVLQENHEEKVEYLRQLKGFLREQPALGDGSDKRGTPQPRETRHTLLQETSDQIFTS